MLDTKALDTRKMPDDAQITEQRAAALRRRTIPEASRRRPWRAMGTPLILLSFAILPYCFYRTDSATLSAWANSPKIPPVWMNTTSAAEENAPRRISSSSPWNALPL